MATNTPADEAAAYARIKQFIYEQWDSTVVPMLCEYIKIPNQSPDYDVEWATDGLIEQAMNLIVDWVKRQPVKGMTVTLLEDRGHRTPFLLVEVDSTIPAAQDPGHTVLMYGHMDKQPPLLPWAEGLGPYTPVIRDGRLYGRGGADDGYAIFASILSIIGLQRENIPHPRIAITIEADEESGSNNLDHWIGQVQSRLGDVRLVICLDSGALSYDCIWNTTSLRGVLNGELKAEVMYEAIHSGIGGGVVPDTTRVLRSLLARIEDVDTGKVLIPELHCDIPPSVVENFQCLNALGPEFMAQYPFLPGIQLPEKSNADHALDNYWRPSLTVTGAEGLPPCSRAGNVLRQSTTFKLSFRAAPKADVKAAAAKIAARLTENPPYNARVTWSGEHVGEGWAAPPLLPWIDQTLRESSLEAFGKSFGEVGLGGSIPFMAMLGRMFKEAQFLVTGVLGPSSNAHGPNEFLDIMFGKRVNYCVTRVLGGFAKAAVRK